MNRCQYRQSASRCQSPTTRRSTPQVRPAGLLSLLERPLLVMSRLTVQSARTCRCVIIASNYDHPENRQPKHHCFTRDRLATLNQNLRRRAGGAKRKRSVLNACRARAKTRQDKYIKTERSRAVAGSAPRGQPRRRTPARRRDRRRSPPPPPDPASASCSSSSSCYHPLPHPFDPVLLPSPRGLERTP